MLCFKANPSPAATEHLTEIAFEVDDQTPEDLATALDRLRALPGVLEVVTVPTLGKAGRLVHGVRTLVRPAQLMEIIQACLP